MINCYRYATRRRKNEINHSVPFVVNQHSIINYWYLFYYFQITKSVQVSTIPAPIIIEHANFTEIITTTVPGAQLPTQCKWTCELTNDRGYVVYSALGSFYIPMLVMLFFYWRIYRAAVRTTRAINQGFKTTKSKWNVLVLSSARAFTICVFICAGFFFVFLLACTQSSHSECNHQQCSLF